MNKDDITTLMTRAVGLVLFTFSLLSVPKALGALLTIGLVCYTGLPKDTLGEKVLTTLRGTQLSQALTHLATFVILLLLARWVFRGPALLKRWMKAEPSDSGNGRLRDRP
jgi:hypothetical protein